MYSDIVGLNNLQFTRYVKAQQQQWGLNWEKKKEKNGCILWSNLFQIEWEGGQQDCYCKLRKRRGAWERIKLDDK